MSKTLPTVLTITSPSGASWLVEGPDLDQVPSVGDLLPVSESGVDGRIDSVVVRPDGRLTLRVSLTSEP